MDKNNPEAVERKILDDQGNVKTVKYEIVDDFVRGRIRDIQFRDSEFGEDLELYMEDGPDVYVLQTKTEGPYGIKLMNKLFNVDFSQDVTILPYYFENDQKSAIVVKQDGEKVPAYFTKDNPGDMPSLPDKVKEKEKWGAAEKRAWKAVKLEIIDFLQELIEKELKPKLKNVKAEDVEGVKEESKDETNDLPF